MTTGRMIELAAAVLLLGRRHIPLPPPRPRGDSVEGYGNQGAVILLVISVIMAIHALGGLDYHPSKAEAEYFKEHAH